MSLSAETPARPKRRSAITVPVRFEFDIPDGIPDANKQLFVKEKAQRICELVSKKGTVVAIQGR